MNETKVRRSSQWFRSARTIATGRASTEIEFLIVSAIGGEQSYQTKLTEDDETYWEAMWNTYVTRVKQASGLDDASDLAAAVRIYDRVSLGKQTGVAA
eukprot:3387804-Alexandrium_andersonii.AAC.1